MNRFAFSLLTSVLVSALAGCGGKSAPATSTTDQATTSADPSLDACTKTFVRQRECTDVFIPALVEVRVKHDLPAGIAAEDKASGREALVAKAKAEWANDSTDDAIAATCGKMMASMEPAMKAQMTEGATQCLAKTECPAFVECVMPMLEQHLSAGH